jgi:hypothetical protein
MWAKGAKKLIKLSAGCYLKAQLENPLTIDRNVTFAYFSHFCLLMATSSFQ